MDELAWGAAWLYRATGDASYLQKAEDFFDSGEMCNSNLWFGWDNKKAGVEVLLYEITGDAKYQTCVDNFMNEIKGAPYTPKGLIFVDNWGSNRHAGNNAHLAAQVLLSPFFLNPLPLTPLLLSAGPHGIQGKRKQCVR